MSRASIVGRSFDASKPFHHIYGRNRYSKDLRLIERDIRSADEARRKLREFRETIGHDYTLTLSSTFEPLP